MSPTSETEIVCAHSPDSDDAFMFYGLATKKIRSKLVTLRHVLEDIESLNRKAMEGTFELTAISYHAYPYLADKYVLMASGSSIGDGYGPMIVSKRPMQPEELKGKRLAIPGKMTTAYLAAKLFEPDFKPFGGNENLRMRFEFTVFNLFNSATVTDKNVAIVHPDDLYIQFDHHDDPFKGFNTRQVMADQGIRVNPMYGLADRFQGPRTARLQLSFFF